MRATLATAVAIEADGVIFHVGSHLGSGFANGLKRVVPALQRLLELTTERTWLLMENSAGAGGTIGRSVDELEVLFERLDGHPRLGLCLDSCHWWVSGVDVTDPETLGAAVADLDRRVGIERLRALHVNDAAAALGSNRDRHARSVKVSWARASASSSPNRRSRVCRRSSRPRPRGPRPRRGGGPVTPRSP